MSRFKLVLASATVFAGIGAAAFAQAPTYDPTQLPAIQGKVAQYSLTPRGDVDGLLMADGTEVHLPPHLSTQLVFAVKPGDAVTIHGLKARAVPMVMAMSITNDATHAEVVATGPHERHGGGTPMEVSGKVKEQLHGPRGDLNGVLLEDGTIVHLPPPEAERLASQLAAGQSIYVRGDGMQNALGHVVAAQAIGPSKDNVTEIHGPRMGWGNRMAGGMAGMFHHHGPHHGMMGHDGPDGAGGPPPPPPQ